MTDEATQAKIDKLAKIEEMNRDRARRYLKRVKEDGKKQLSAIISGKAYDQLCRIRDKALQAGNPTSFGKIIEDALGHYIDNQGKINDPFNDNDNVNINETKQKQSAPPIDPMPKNKNTSAGNQIKETQTEIPGPAPGKTPSTAELDKLVLEAESKFPRDNNARAKYLNDQGVLKPVKGGGTEKWTKFNFSQYLSNVKHRRKK